MCGIAGAIGLPEGVAQDRVGRMITAQYHRGPDARGIWADDLCVLGSRRLSIIDLSDAARQPVGNEDSSVWVTFNGEIYNFAALRTRLEALGHAFRTRTDTEVIVHAYEQWGVECLAEFRGMFAFGLWDRARRRLFLARDRVGKKPLFYTSAGGRFLFASELQGLLADPEVPREVDAEALDTYLSLGYIPAPRTGFRDIAKLPPAHWLMAEPDGRGVLAIQTGRYWRLDYQPKLQVSEGEAIDAVRERLAEAVRLRMVSDVPLGAFLSGGVDSSIVVGLMAAASSRPVRTFSIGFEDARYDELPHARRIARRWSTDHQEFVVRPDLADVLPRLVRHYGEPYADSSALPTFYVSKLARTQVTVALNGDGGDESFAGYDRYLANRVAEQVRRVPGIKAVAAAAARLLPTSLEPKSQLRRIGRFVEGAAREMPARYGRWMAIVPNEVKSELYGDDLRAQLEARATDRWLDTLFAESALSDPVDAAMAVDVASYLPYDLLVKADITSMANSLEVRSPFLDHEVMEFAARLPVALKLRGTTRKYLLRRAFADLLPAENVARRKMGFGVPVHAWLRGELRPLLEDALLADQGLKRGYFRPATVRRLVAEHLEGVRDHGTTLWSLLVLELWHREFIDRC